MWNVELFKANPLLQEIHWLSVQERITFKILMTAYKRSSWKSPQLHVYYWFTKELKSPILIIINHTVVKINQCYEFPFQHGSILSFKTVHNGPLSFIWRVWNNLALLGLRSMYGSNSDCAKQIIWIIIIPFAMGISASPSPVVMTDISTCPTSLPTLVAHIAVPLTGSANLFIIFFVESILRMRPKVDVNSALTSGNLIRTSCR